MNKVDNGQELICELVCHVSEPLYGTVGSSRGGGVSEALHFNGKVVGHATSAISGESYGSGSEFHSRNISVEFRSTSDSTVHAGNMLGEECFGNLFILGDAEERDFVANNKLKKYPSITVYIFVPANQLLAYRQLAIAAELDNKQLCIEVEFRVQPDQLMISSSDLASLPGDIRIPYLRDLNVRSRERFDVTSIKLSKLVYDRTCTLVKPLQRSKPAVENCPSALDIQVQEVRRFRSGVDAYDKVEILGALVRKFDHSKTRDGISNERPCSVWIDFESFEEYGNINGEPFGDEEFFGEFHFDDDRDPKYPTDDAHLSLRLTGHAETFQSRILEPLEMRPNSSFVLSIKVDTPIDWGSKVTGKILKYDLYETQRFSIDAGPE